MSDENLRRNTELIKQYPLIKDVAWVILGGAIILFDVIDLLWILGLVLCVVGVWGAAAHISPKRDG